MDTNNSEVITDACVLLLKHMNPILLIKEKSDQYIPLYCYTATSSYALGLTAQERHEVILNLRKLFDFFYELTIEKDGIFHAAWKEYTFHSVSHEGTARNHRQNISNFTEGNTFVCIGSPDGYYFDDNELGLEFGEITYAIYGLYNFLKNNTDYNHLLNNELQTASDLYESIINNPANRRIFLRMKLKKTDIAYLSDAINDVHQATVESVDEKVKWLIGSYLPTRDPRFHLNSAAACSAMLNSNFQFAKPLGNCKYELCEGVEEIKDIIFEREMVSTYIKLERVILKDRSL